MEGLEEGLMNIGMWVRLGICRYTLGICYLQLREASNAKFELMRAYEVLNSHAHGEVSEKLIKHLEKLIKASRTEK